jgi:hypothetical protein
MHRLRALPALSRRFRSESRRQLHRTPRYRNNPIVRRIGEHKPRDTKPLKKLCKLKVGRDCRVQPGKLREHGPDIEPLRQIVNFSFMMAQLLPVHWHLKRLIT